MCFGILTQAAYRTALARQETSPPGDFVGYTHRV